MMLEPTAIQQLTRDLKFIADMIELAAKAGNYRDALRYVGSAGNLLNKITEEVNK